MAKTANLAYVLIGVMAACLMLLVPLAIYGTLDNIKRESLYLAAAENRIDDLREILKNGADPNGIPSEFSDSPLFIAVANRHTEAASILVEAGAKAKLESDGGTPWQVARSPELQRILKKAIDWSSQKNFHRK